MPHHSPGHRSLASMGKDTKKCWFIEINSVSIYSSLGAFNIEKASVPTIVFRDIPCPPLVKTEVQQGSAAGVQRTGIWLSQHSGESPPWELGIINTKVDCRTLNAADARRIIKQGTEYKYYCQLNTNS